MPGDTHMRKLDAAGGKRQAGLGTTPPDKRSLRKFKVAGTGEPADRVLNAKKLEGNIRVEVDGHIVALTSLDKVYWAEQGYTKGDLIRYYYRVAEALLPYLEDRPLILKRFPDGIGGKFFFQHDVDETPDYVETYSTDLSGHTVDYVVCNNRATLLYLANLGVIPLHPWHSRVHNIDCPDWMVFDLDPGKVQFKTVRRVAGAVRAVLAQLGLESYVKTSGSRGLHVYVPIVPVYTYEEVARFAERVAKRIVEENPRATTLVRPLDRRPPNTIYVDHLQNARGKTIVAPYSVRERTLASVSAPLTWREAQGTAEPGDFTIKTMPARLKRRGDRFRGVLDKPQRLEEPSRRL